MEIQPNSCRPEGPELVPVALRQPLAWPPPRLSSPRRHPPELSLRPLPPAWRQPPMGTVPKLALPTSAAQTRSAFRYFFPDVSLLSSTFPISPSSLVILSRSRIAVRKSGRSHHPQQWIHSLRSATGQLGIHIHQQLVVPLRLRLHCLLPGLPVGWNRHCCS